MGLFRGSRQKEQEVGTVLIEEPRFNEGWRVQFEGDLSSPDPDALDRVRCLSSIAGYVMGIAALWSASPFPPVVINDDLDRLLAILPAEDYMDWPEAGSYSLALPPRLEQHSVESPLTMRGRVLAVGGERWAVEWTTRASDESTPSLESLRLAWLNLTLEAFRTIDENLHRQVLRNALRTVRQRAMVEDKNEVLADPFGYVDHVYKRGYDLLF
jgi:hypothetical protein